MNMREKHTRVSHVCHPKSNFSRKVRETSPSDVQDSWLVRRPPPWPSADPFEARSTTADDETLTDL